MVVDHAAPAVGIEHGQVARQFETVDHLKHTVVLLMGTEVEYQAVGLTGPDLPGAPAFARRQEHGGHKDGDE